MQILNHFDGVPTDSRKCGQVSAPSSLPEPSFPSFECAGEAGGDSWFENLPFCLIWRQQFWGIFVLHYVAHAVCPINSRDFATGQNGQRQWSLLRSMAELALCSMLCLLLLGVYVRLTKLGTLDYLLIFVCLSQRGTCDSMSCRVKWLAQWIDGQKILTRFSRAILDIDCQAIKYELWMGIFQRAGRGWLLTPWTNMEQWGWEHICDSQVPTPAPVVPKDGRQ